MSAVNETSKHGHLTIKQDESGLVRAARETAESRVVMELMRGQGGQTRARFDVADSIDVSGFPDLLAELCDAADLHLDLDFTATRLSSSHVVLEDVGLTLGAALFQMLTDRMITSGINGAGSSLRTADDFENAPVSASVSVEGRKFLKIVSATTMEDMRWRLILGQTLSGNIRSEDIDDFVDALAGGLKGSIFINERTVHTDADAFWRGTFRALGLAIHEALAPNPARKGLPPGVKATLF
ncbi:MAG: hypothetical protein AAFX86_14750 [Pseudomonadota bacterium]